MRGLDMDLYPRQLQQGRLSVRTIDSPPSNEKRMFPFEDGQPKYFSLYVDLREVRFDGKRVFLTKCETLVLVAIMEAGPVSVPRTQLMQSIWGEVTDHAYARLAVHLSQVVKKLRECTGIPRLILGRRGCVRFDYTALSSPAIITRCAVVYPA